MDFAHRARTPSLRYICVIHRTNNIIRPPPFEKATIGLRDRRQPWLLDRVEPRCLSTPFGCQLAIGLSAKRSVSDLSVRVSFGAQHPPHSTKRTDRSQVGSTIQHLHLVRLSLFLGTIASPAKKPCPLARTPSRRCDWTQLSCLRAHLCHHSRHMI